MASDQSTSWEVTSAAGITANRRASLVALHRAKMAGESSVDGPIAEALVPLLYQRLRYGWPHVSVEVAMSVVHDVVLWYLTNARKYDDAAASLDVFLGHVAHRRLQDSYRQHRRRVAHEVCLGPVQWAAAIALRDRDAAPRDDEADQAAIRARLLELAHSDVERRFLCQYLDTGDWESCGVVFGLAKPSAAARASAIHRMTMRLRQRASRMKAKKTTVTVSGGHREIE